MFELRFTQVPALGIKETRRHLRVIQKVPRDVREASSDSRENSNCVVGKSVVLFRDPSGTCVDRTFYSATARCGPRFLDLWGGTA